MKIAILCPHLPNYQRLADITVYHNKGDYAKRHGYELIVKTTLDPHYSVPEAHAFGMSWDRLADAVKLLKAGKHDWVYVVGVDTLITNYTIPLESLCDNNAAMVISSDWCSAVQADSFLLRCSPEGVTYASAILAKFKDYRNHPWVEQQAMIDSLPRFKSWVKILPQRAMNSYDYPLHLPQYPKEPKVKSGTDYYGHDGQWQKGDFLIHWPGLSIVERLKQADRFYPMIVK